MINGKADEVTEECFQSFLSRYQNKLKTSIRSGDFIFGCVNLLYKKCRKINFERGGSYIDSPDWIRSKKVTVNPINKKGNKCFQYAYHLG